MGTTSTLTRVVWRRNLKVVSALVKLDLLAQRPSHGVLAISIDTQEAVEAVACKHGARQPRKFAIERSSVIAGGQRQKHGTFIEVIARVAKYYRFGRPSDGGTIIGVSGFWVGVARHHGGREGEVERTDRTVELMLANKETGMV